MRPCGKLPQEYNVRERKIERNNLESKNQANLCKPNGVQLTEKINQPIIQPSVIQALPSALGTLPSLQSTGKRSCPPNSPTKQRKSVPKPKSALGRILPNLPRIEDLTVPCVGKRVESSSNQLPILPTIKERMLPCVQFPKTRKHVGVKRVRRVLPCIPSIEAPTPPSIPLPETRDPPRIQPTAFKSLTKCKGSRRKQMLPSLPIIEEQTSLKLDGETLNKQHSAVGKNEASLGKNEDEMLPSLQQVWKSTPEGLQQGQKDKLQSIKEDIQSLKPRIKEVRNKPNKTVKKPQAIIKPVEQDTRPSLKLVDKERLYGSDITAKQDRVKSPKENSSNRLKVLQASNSPQTERKEKPCGLKPMQTSEGTAAQTLSTTQPLRGDRKLNQLRGKERLRAKRSQNSCLLEAKKVSSSFKRTNRDTVQETQPAVEQKLPRRPTEKQERASSQTTEGKALLRLRATANLIKNSRESKEKKECPNLIKKEAPPHHRTTEGQQLPRPPAGGTTRTSAPWSGQREVMPRPSLSSVDSYALLNCMRRKSAASIQSCQDREKVDKSRFQPVMNRNHASLLSEESYALLSLKRKEFEVLPRPQQLTGKRGQTNSKRSVQEGNTRILTVKPALPSIQPKQESTMLKPPTAPTIMKGLPSARPNLERAHPKIQITVSRLLTSIQPIVKQVLPSLNSQSSLQKLVKKPLPSVQPEDKFCSPDAVQTTVNSNFQHLKLGTETQKNSNGDISLINDTK